MHELERHYILHTLKVVEGNKTRAAQLLGLDRRTLYRKLDRERESAAVSLRSESEPSGRSGPFTS